MLSFIVRVGLFILLFNVFLTVSNLVYSGNIFSTPVNINLTDIEAEIQQSSDYSTLQPFLFFTWLTLVKMWNILTSLIANTFLMGELIRAFVPIIPTEITMTLNVISSALIVYALVEFFRGMRL